MLTITKHSNGDNIALYEICIEVSNYFRKHIEVNTALKISI